MKTFLVINGKYAFTLKREDLESAKLAAINYCDCSIEIIVREIDNFIDYANIQK